MHCYLTYDISYPRVCNELNFGSSMSDLLDNKWMIASNAYEEALLITLRIYFTKIVIFCLIEFHHVKIILRYFLAIKSFCGDLVRLQIICTIMKITSSGTRRWHEQSENFVAYWIITGLKFADIVVLEESISKCLVLIVTRSIHVQREIFSSYTRKISCCIN